MKIVIGRTAEPMLQSAAISDLFFNYDHPAHDALYRHSGSKADDHGVSEEDKRAALMKDAADFCASLQQATGFSLEEAELVDDYLSRE